MSSVVQRLAGATMSVLVCLPAAVYRMTEIAFFSCVSQFFVSGVAPRPQKSRVSHNSVMVHVLIRVAFASCNWSATLPVGDSSMKAPEAITYNLLGQEKWSLVLYSAS